METVECFLHAIRIVTGVDTGFAQIYMRPVGWADGFRADLPELIPGALIRGYPPSFNERGWLVKDRITLTAEELATAGALTERLKAAADPIKLASRRLSLSMLREDETDSIVDRCVGLEAALGDRSSGDTTYKLGIRTAAVLRAGDRTALPAAEILSHIKKIYSYRSAVVHGGNPAKSRTIRSSDGSERPTVDVAKVFLRLVLWMLIEHPELEDAAAIDRELVLGALDDD
jgi:hypothetical protein